MGMANCPKLDFAGMVARMDAMTEAEKEALYQEAENPPKKDWRKFVQNVREHPEGLLSWDMDISFEEFARRVDAGEFD